MEYKNPSILKAFAWLSQKQSVAFLLPNEQCETRDVFQARLEKMRQDMSTDNSLKDIYFLVTAVIGEIGNNAFDHNLGNWRDEKGVYFVYNLEERFVIIADRGQGLLATLSRVAPELQSEAEAIHLAFTKIISGRSPERRGNGLKFVETIVREHHLKVHFYSGNGMYIVNNGLKKGGTTETLHGVLAILFF